MGQAHRSGSSERKPILRPLTQEELDTLVVRLCNADLRVKLWAEAKVGANGEGVVCSLLGGFLKDLTGGCKRGLPREEFVVRTGLVSDDLLGQPEKLRAALNNWLHEKSKRTVFANSPARIIELARQTLRKFMYGDDSEAAHAETWSSTADFIERFFFCPNKPLLSRYFCPTRRFLRGPVGYAEAASFYYRALGSAEPGREVWLISGWGEFVSGMRESSKELSSRGWSDQRAEGYYAELVRNISYRRVSLPEDFRRLLARCVANGMKVRFLVPEIGAERMNGPLRSALAARHAIQRSLRMGDGDAVSVHCLNPGMIIVKADCGQRPRWAGEYLTPAVRHVIVSRADGHADGAHVLRPMLYENEVNGVVELEVEEVVDLLDWISRFRNHMKEYSV